MPFKLDGITRVDDTPVHKAIREALANCLINTDFYVPRGVVIRKDTEKIILENPGYIRTGREQMLRGGISDPRNKALMKMFNIIGIGERAGSGVPDIFAVWDSQGWEPPVLDERFDPDRTTLTLTFTKKRAAKTSGKNERKIQAANTSDKTEHEVLPKSRPISSGKKRLILEYLQTNGSGNSREIAEGIGLSIQRTRTLLAQLIEEGKVKAEGNSRSRRYLPAQKPVST